MVNYINHMMVNWWTSIMMDYWCPIKIIYRNLTIWKNVYYNIMVVEKYRMPHRLHRVNFWVFENKCIIKKVKGNRPNIDNFCIYITRLGIFPF